MPGPAAAAPAPTGFSAGDAGTRILAAGDSMMRGVDVSLGRELAAIQDVSFRRDLRIGSGISKLNWVRLAGRQVRAHQPRATAIFMGAVDGFPMAGIRCCREPWIAEYANRVKKMIRTYSRGGLGDVYYLTLPAPRPDAQRTRVFNAVNRAIRRAVRVSGPRAHLVDTWAVLTPKGRYRRSMIWKGRLVTVRTLGGVHLEGEGPAIAAQLIRDAMRRDGVVG